MLSSSRDGTFACVRRTRKREPRCPLESREGAASARKERKREREACEKIDDRRVVDVFFLSLDSTRLDSLAHRAFSMSPLIDDGGTGAGAGGGVAIAVAPPPSLAAAAAAAAAGATATVTISESGGAKGGGRVDEQARDDDEPRTMELAAAAPPPPPPPSPRAKPPQGTCWSARVPPPPFRCAENRAIASRKRGRTNPSS